MSRRTTSGTVHGATKYHTIVAEQRKDFVLIHGDRQVIHGCLHTIRRLESLDEILHDYGLVVLCFQRFGRRRWLESTRVCVGVSFFGC